MDEAWHEQVGRREAWEREQATADALLAIFGLVRKEIEDFKEEEHGNQHEVVA